MTTEPDYTDRVSGGRRGGLVRIVAIVIAGVVAVGLLALALGLVALPGQSSPARPPCDQLPAVGEVQKALSTRTALTGRIEAVGDGVKVTLATPCDDPNRALVRITVSSADERAGVEAIMAADGFGAPAELAMR